MRDCDLVEVLETEFARGLFAIDRACMIAKALQGQNEASSITRALAARAAIQGAGIELPPLREINRSLQDQGRRREEAAFLLEAGLSLTTREISDLAGVDRTTIMRWAQRIGGEIWSKYKSARRQGDPVRFSPAEVQAILQTGESSSRGR